MKIAFLTNFIPPYRVSFYEKLCRHPRHGVRVLHGRVSGETGRPAFDGALSFDSAEVRNAERHWGTVTVRWQPGALAAVRRCQPDTVVLLGMVGSLSNWAVLAWARLTGRKVLVWACGWEPQQPGSWVWRIKRLFTRVYFSLADQCLLYSSKGRQQLIDSGVPGHRMQVCYNGIETDALLAQQDSVQAQARSLREADGHPQGPLFLYVGGLIEDKRVDLLLAAFRVVLRGTPGARLWIVGDGPHREALRRDAADLSAQQVRWLGRIVDGVDAYFAAADVFVLPGIGGLAFNQAMFWRTPCVGSEADGTEDDLVIEGRTGFRFEAGNADSLAQAMVRAARSDRLAEIAEAAHRLIVERSNVNAMVRLFHETFDALDGGGPVGNAPQARST